jgi:hypothetical protein
MTHLGGNVAGHVVKCICKGNLTTYKACNKITLMKQILVNTHCFFASKITATHKYLHLLFLLLLTDIITFNSGLSCSHYITRKFLSQSMTGTCKFHLSPTQIWTRALARVTLCTTAMPTLVLCNNKQWTQHFIHHHKLVANCKRKILYIRHQFFATLSIWPTKTKCHECIHIYEHVCVLLWLMYRAQRDFSQNL